jgi:hypothetical protein
MGRGRFDTARAGGGAIGVARSGKHGTHIPQSSSILRSGIITASEFGIFGGLVGDLLMQWVTPAQVFDALSFYLDNTAEIDEKIAWYEAHPLLNVPVELRCYPDWDEVDAFTAEYRQQRNAELSSI